MSMFPGAGAVVYTNDEGEPLGWDYPSYDDAPEPDDYYASWDDDEDECGDCQGCRNDDGCYQDDDYQGGEDSWLDGSYEE